MPTQVRCQLVPDRISQTADDTRQQGGEKYSYIEHRDGNRTELVVQGNVYWLRAKVWDGRLGGGLLSAMKGAEMRSLEE